MADWDDQAAEGGCCYAGRSACSTCPLADARGVVNPQGALAVIRARLAAMSPEDKARMEAECDELLAMSPAEEFRREYDASLDREIAEARASLTVSDLTRAGQDPWYSRLRGRLSDWTRCHIRRRHQVKMGSHGRCYRCGKVVGRG